MTVPLVVLAVLSTVGGLVGIPYAVSSMFGKGDMNVFEQYAGADHCSCRS